MNLDAFAFSLHSACPCWFDGFSMDWTMTNDELPPLFEEAIFGERGSGTFHPSRVVTHEETGESMHPIDENPESVLDKLKRKPKRRRVRKKYDAPFGQRTYHELTEKDVGLGRGESMNRHAGNVRFRQVKDELQPLYLCTPQVDRTPIAQELVDAVHEWGGRFLKKDTEGWYEVHNHTARTKCSQALREALTPEQKAAKRKFYRDRKKQQQQEQEGQNET